MDIDIKSHITIWERYKDNRRNDNIYLSDVEFNKHFELKYKEGYISTVFEILDGEYGFNRDIEYYNFYVPKSPIIVNYKTLQLTILNSECEDVKSLQKHQLTIFNSSYLITTSEYLKPICILLFSTYKFVEGVSYVFNNLIEIISHVLPKFLIVKNPLDGNIISLPFTVEFVNEILNKYEAKFYYSQIEKTLYKIKDA